MIVRQIQNETPSWIRTQRDRNGGCVASSAISYLLLARCFWQKRPRLRARCATGLICENGQGPFPTSGGRSANVGDGARVGRRTGSTSSHFAKQYRRLLASSAVGAVTTERLALMAVAPCGQGLRRDARRGRTTRHVTTPATTEQGATGAVNSSFEGTFNVGIRTPQYQA